VGTVRILYRVSTISLQAVMHPDHTLRALNMKEEEEFLFHLHLTVLLFHDYKEEFGVCFRIIILIFCVSVWKIV